MFYRESPHGVMDLLGGLSFAAVRVHVAVSVYRPPLSMLCSCPLPHGRVNPVQNRVMCSALTVSGWELE